MAEDTPINVEKLVSDKIEKGVIGSTLILENRKLGDDNLAERINTLFSYRAHIQMESLNDTLALEKKLESDIIHTIMVGLSLKEKYYNMMVASIMQICEE